MCLDCGMDRTCCRFAGDHVLCESDLIKSPSEEMIGVEDGRHEACPL